MNVVARGPRDRRYWDAHRKEWTVSIVAGELYVTARDEALITVLGSCVALCVRDPRLGVGGMNHMLLPEDGDEQTIVARLLAGVRKFGSDPQDLEIKLFGGGRVLRMVSDVGESNLASVRDCLARRNLAIHAMDTGGGDARQLRYYPRTGRALIRRLPLAA